MDFHQPELKRSLLMVVMSAMVLSAGAQSTDRSIIFSTPQTEEAQTGASLFAPKNSQPGILPGMLQAPMQFNFRPANDIHQSPDSLPNFAQQQRMKKILEERKNWILMTPEEILGNSTTQKTLETSEQDMLGNDKNRTQLGRFLEHNSELRNGPTNGLPNDRRGLLWNFSHDSDNGNALISGQDRPSQAVLGWGQLFHSRQSQDVVPVKNGNFIWPDFGHATVQSTTKPDEEQLAAMERFRQLLNPSSAESAQPSSDSQYFPVNKPAVNSIIQQPDFIPNPAGASFVPLSSGIARPAGLAPLPGMTGFAAPVTAPVTVPLGRPQPPPWLLQGPQPFVMPQRKF